MITKHFEPSFTLIGDLLFSSSFTAKGGAVFLNERNISLSKADKQFRISFNLVFDERKFVNDVLDTPIEEYTITTDSGRVFILPLKSTLLTSVRDINDEPDFEVSGTVTQISTKPIKDFDTKYHRVFIPVPDKHFSFFDFQHFTFNADSNSKNKQLIKVAIKEMHFHLYTFKIDDKIYWAIDSLQVLEFRKFQEMAFSIFNAYGFIKGDLHLNEAYYFASDSPDFNSNLEMFFSSIRDSLLTGYGMITRNPYSVFVPFFKGQGKPLDKAFIDDWYKKLNQFEESVFSKIADTFYEFDSLTRAALIILEANTQPLELKAASYCVAFEAVCHTIKKHFGIDSPTVIDTAVFNTDVKPQFLSLLDQLEKDSKIDAKQKDILSRKLNNWNQPTNADSLVAPFRKYGYELNKDEFKCVDNRNQFLHGSLPINERNEDEAFRELYHISLTIHKLIYILLFKMVGYDGYIINYPRMHTHITGRKIEEDLLIKI